MEAFTEAPFFSDKVIRARRFFLRASAARTPFRVVSGGIEHCRIDYLVDRTSFPGWVIEFVAGGAGLLSIGDRDYPLSPGSVFFYGHKMAHRIATDPAHPLVKYFVVLNGAEARRQLEATGLQAGVPGKIGEMDRVRSVLEDMIEMALGDRADREEGCSLAARYLLSLVTRSLLPDARAEARAYATYERCRAYIEANALKIRDLREVAAACHVDTAYLCRLFQRFRRERPKQYLQHLRMNYAVAELKAGRRLVKDLAIELGYADPANFTRAYRQWFGVAPRAARGV